MTASDIAARRIREARTRKGWRVKDLAERCAKAGAGNITAAVITNLETRRRPGREITADELLVLAWVLEVPPVQLLSPLGDEALLVVPGEEKGTPDAMAWLTAHDAATFPGRPAPNVRTKTEHEPGPEDLPFTLEPQEIELAMAHLRDIHRILRARLAEGIPRPDGLQMFGDPGWDATQWDDLIARGFSQAEVAAVLAIVRAKAYSAEMRALVEATAEQRQQRRAVG